MKVRVPITTYHEIALSDEQMRDATFEYIYKTFGLQSDYFVDNKGRLVYEEEHHTSHSYWSTEVVKEQASELDKAALDFLKLLRSMPVLNSLTK